MLPTRSHRHARGDGAGGARRPRAGGAVTLGACRLDSWELAAMAAGQVLYIHTFDYQDEKTVGH